MIFSLKTSTLPCLKSWQHPRWYAKAFEAGTPMRDIFNKGRTRKFLGDGVKDHVAITAQNWFKFMWQLEEKVAIARIQNFTITKFTKLEIIFPEPRHAVVLGTYLGKCPDAGQSEETETPPPRASRWNQRAAPSLGHLSALDKVWKGQPRKDFYPQIVVHHFLGLTSRHRQQSFALITPNIWHTPISNLPCFNSAVYIFINLQATTSKSENQNKNTREMDEERRATYRSTWMRDSGRDNNPRCVSTQNSN